MENDIEIVEQGKFVMIKVPLYVPKALYDGGAVETLARYDGYTDKITGPEGVEIDNPDSPLVFDVKNIQKTVKEKFRSIMEKQGEEQGREEAKAQFEALFN